MLRRVALVRIDVSEELSASFIRVTRIGELGTTLAVTSNRSRLRRNINWLLVTASVVPSSPIFVTLMKEVLPSSETWVLTRATRRNIPEDTILQLVSYLTASTISSFGHNNDDFWVYHYEKPKQFIWASLRLSMCLSVHVQQLYIRRRNLHEIRYWQVVLKSVRNADNNHGTCTGIVWGNTAELAASTARMCSGQPVHTVAGITPRAMGTPDHQLATLSTMNAAVGESRIDTRH
jgi:hypothetical protein